MSRTKVLPGSFKPRVPTDNFHLTFAKNGKSVGLNGDIDPINSKTLTSAERSSALTAFANGESGVDANISYPIWLVPLWCCFASYCLYQALTHPDSSLLSATVIFVITYFFTDVISGVFHLVLDNPLFINQSPIDSMCRGFQEHHLDPTLIFKMSLFNHVRVMGQPLVGVWVLSMPLEFIAGKTMYHFHVYYLCLSVMLVYMQCCHRWAHMPFKMRGPVIRTLQNLRLALPAGEHLNHHGAPYMQNFCIMNGMTNPLLNFVTQKILHPHSKLWAPVFLICAYMPGCVCLALNLANLV